MRRPSFHLGAAEACCYYACDRMADYRALRNPKFCFRITSKFSIRTDLEVLKRLSKTAFRNSNLFGFYDCLKLTEYAPRTRPPPPLSPDTVWVNFGT